MASSVTVSWIIMQVPTTDQLESTASHSPLRSTTRHNSAQAASNCFLACNTACIFVSPSSHAGFQAGDNSKSLWHFSVFPLAMQVRLCTTASFWYKYVILSTAGVKWSQHSKKLCNTVCSILFFLFISDDETCTAVLRTPTLASYLVLTRLAC